jgi:NAD(P)H-hydrate epimerase
MRDVEARAFSAGIVEQTLMEEAGAGAAKYVREYWPGPGVAVVFAGKGHNAGDAFVIAGHLLEVGWRVELRLAWPEETLRPLAALQLEAVRERVTFAAVDASAVPPGVARVISRSRSRLGTWR